MNFRNDPVFQAVVQKYSGHAPFIGLIGTIVGIVRALQRLETEEGSITLVAAAILEALLWSAVAVALFILVRFLHCWRIKQRR